MTPTDPVPRQPGALRGRVVLYEEFGALSIYTSFDTTEGFREYDWACHLSLADGCELERCAKSQGGTSGNLLHAGTFTLTNISKQKTLMAAPSATPGQNTRTLYEQLDPVVLGMATGDTIRIEASGNTPVPSFQTEIQVPSPVDLTAPKGAFSGERQAFLGTNGLAVAWTSGAESVLVEYRYGPFGFSALDPSFNATGRCVFQGPPGHAGLSPSLFHDVGCATYSFVTLGGVSEAQITEGGYLVTIQLVTTGNTSGTYVDCTK